MKVARGMSMSYIHFALFAANRSRSSIVAQPGFWRRDAKKRPTANTEVVDR
jgi:hypothetical protein